MNDDVKEQFSRLVHIRACADLEPTAGQDPQTAEALQQIYDMAHEAIVKLRCGRQAGAVTHSE